MTIKKLKLDDDKKPVMQDGLPVYVYEDGSESPFDAVKTVKSLNAKIEDLNEGVTKTKEVNSKLREELKPWKGLDNKKAREALETVAALSSKEILDANGVKTLKNEMRSSFDDEKRGILQTHEKELQERDTVVADKDKTIRHLMITSEFAKSDYFTGEKPKTIYPPNDAVQIFGKHFIVSGEGTNVKVVAVQSDGKTPIMSKKDHGEPADFNEAIGILIDNHPQKNRILNTTPGGPGAPPGGPGSHDDKDVKGVDRIKRGLAAIKDQQQAAQPRL